jgi:IS5 family transposase
VRNDDDAASDQKQASVDLEVISADRGKRGDRDRERDLEVEKERELERYERERERERIRRDRERENRLRETEQTTTPMMTCPEAEVLSLMVENTLKPPSSPRRCD